MAPLPRRLWHRCRAAYGTAAAPPMAPLPRRDGNKKKVNRAAAATVTLKISGFLSL